MSQKDQNRFRRIGKKWRESVDKTREYDVVESEYIYEDLIPSNYYGFTTSREYQAAQKLKQRLFHMYKGKSLDDIVPGENLKTERGNCYHIKNHETINLKKIDARIVRSKIITELKLIRGIGEVHASRLKESGCVTIEDLKDHKRFGDEAKEFLDLLDKGNTTEIMDHLVHWLPRSHPLVLFLSSLHREEDFVILDIESLGLFTRPIVLFGVASIIGDQIATHQYLVRNMKEEPAALIALLSHFTPRSALITFNGRAFDVPYIIERLAYYGLPGDLDRPHFDILHFSRRAWRAFVPDCRKSETSLDNNQKSESE